ncbi:hypothetical protein HR17_05375 [Porphyromonas gulae]|uniref:hypothetical protein n=1 Tax=Porphyromonas gulae TaxID=111105 RepID=UPI00052BEA8A|nr:hypothetical protein [Porphyromonas gulae]KGN74563.1 hypothetical protein HR17_05375 [Porphyromonas gulae]KGO04731.1 hypothetical protein HR16_03535 [Porphyromonas gulae]
MDGTVSQWRAFGKTVEDFGQAYQSDRPDLGSSIGCIPRQSNRNHGRGEMDKRHMIQDAKTRGDFYSMSIKKTSKHWVGTLSFIYSDPGEYRTLSLTDDAMATYSKYSLKAYSLSLTLQYRF